MKKLSYFISIFALGMMLTACSNTNDTSTDSTPSIPAVTTPLPESKIDNAPRQIIESDRDTQEKHEQREITNPNSKNGWIEGSLSYPSEIIPDEVVVCVENFKTKITNCTDQRIFGEKHSFGVGYKIEVTPGDYYVYSKEDRTGGFPRDYKAYYDEFVKCGIQASCTSHEPIKITVRAGETVSGIDPIDWYLDW